MPRRDLFSFRYRNTVAGKSARYVAERHGIAVRAVKRLRQDADFVFEECELPFVMEGFNGPLGGFDAFSARITDEDGSRPASIGIVEKPTSPRSAE